MHESDSSLDRLEELLLGERPSLTRGQVAEQAGVDLDTARELWRLLGFAETDDDTIAFTSADVRSLQHVRALVDLGVLDQDREDGLVRTWARSFARLAEWQAALLASVAEEQGVDATDGALLLGGEVVPRVEELQAIVWRRHLLSAAARASVGAGGSVGSVGSVGAGGAGGSVGSAPGEARAVCFIDIVGYTARSKTLTDRELAAWLEGFESGVLAIAGPLGARIIKNIGDELLIVADTAEDAATLAGAVIARGEDPDDEFPQVRAGIAYGAVLARLGDVYGPVVNVAARLTSVARAGTVLIDEGMHAALTGALDSAEAGDGEVADSEVGGGSPYRFRRLKRLSVKGYPRLRAWALRPRGTD